MFGPRTARLCVVACLIGVALLGYGLLLARQSGGDHTPVCDHRAMGPGDVCVSSPSGRTETYTERHVDRLASDHDAGTSSPIVMAGGGFIALLGAAGAIADRVRRPTTSPTTSPTTRSGAGAADPTWWARRPENGEDTRDH